MRIFAVSDIHVDYEANLNWVKQLSVYDYQEDILILAGDVTDFPAILAEAFQLLRARFAEVLFVPGNHDVWVHRSKETDSFEKLKLVNHIAREEGVIQQPLLMKGLYLLPLLGWYDYTFGPKTEYLSNAWMDFYGCKWQGRDEAWLTSWFLSQNKLEIPDTARSVITYSHFLPRIDVQPDFIPPKHQRVYPVLGSSRIDQQIRQCGSTMHVYGHSHVNRHVTIDGVTYINNAFGYPSETRITAKTLRCLTELS